MKINARAALRFPAMSILERLTELKLDQRDTCGGIEFLPQVDRALR
jgi:hypothetical protein